MIRLPLLRRKRAFTLAEMMLTLGLVALLYTMISTIVIQISRYVRNGREVAQERRALLSTVESVRYQLRSLYYPSGAPGLLGQRSALQGRDNLRFLTTNGVTNRGVVEGSYRIDKLTNSNQEEETTGLFYREFPFRRQEFRSLDAQDEAEWTLTLPNVSRFELEYSSDGAIFQREWDETTPPNRIRLRIARGGANRDSMVFDVTPGIGAGRW